MRAQNAIGLFICGALFASGFFINGNLGLYFNLSGLLIVIGGGISATLVSYRAERLAIVWRVLRASYAPRKVAPITLIETLVHLSIRSHFDGMFALEEEEAGIEDRFFRNAVETLVDGCDEKEIRSVLDAEMHFFALRRQHCEQVLRTTAEFFPAFGLIGSVVGLVTMLASIEDPTTLLHTVPVALTSTLYGVVIANFLLLPFAAHLREHTEQELLLQELVTEGVLAIRAQVKPRVLERRLRSFLTPADRPDEHLSRRLMDDRRDARLPHAPLTRAAGRRAPLAPPLPGAMPTGDLSGLDAATEVTSFD
jgi:chemotaxis protein MotA